MIPGTRVSSRFYANLFEAQKWTIFAPAGCDFNFELPCTSVTSYTRLYVKTVLLFFGYDTETTRTTCVYSCSVLQVPSINQRFVLPLYFTTCTSIVLLYEKGNVIRILPRPIFPSTCRLYESSSRRLFRPQASGDIRACSASREHRVGSLTIVAYDQTRAHGSNSTRSSPTTPGSDDGTHIHRIVCPRCHTESSWLRAEGVRTCARPLQSVYAAAELVCHGRVVVVLVSIMNTAAVGRAIPPYNSVRNIPIYVVDQI